MLFEYDPEAQSSNITILFFNAETLLYFVLLLNRSDTSIQIPCKIDLLLTLNLCGESHDKGLPENANVKAP